MFGRRVRKIKQRSVGWNKRRKECRTEVVFVFFSLMGKGRKSNVPLAHTQSWHKDAITASKDEMQEKKVRVFLL